MPSPPKAVEKTARRRDVALALLIDTQGRFFLQERDNKPGIAEPGKVSLFGGGREGKETYPECVAREVMEEIGYSILPNKFTRLDAYITPDRNVHCEIFVAVGVPADGLTVTEGSPLTIDQEKADTIRHKLAPVALFAIEAFFREKKAGRRFQ